MCCKYHNIVSFIVFLQVVSSPDSDSLWTVVLEMWSFFMTGPGSQCAKVLFKRQMCATSSVRSLGVVRLSKRFPTLTSYNQGNTSFHNLSVKEQRHYQIVISLHKKRPALLLASSAQVCVIIFSLLNSPYTV